MYGYQPPAARRLAQLPGQYADGGAVGFGSRGLSQLRDMIPKVQAMGYQQAAPAPAAPSAADRLRTLIPQMEAMGYKQQPQYLARGGMVRGPGTGTSDSIETEAEPGTFIMPADSTKALGKSALEKLATVPVKLSNGEFEFPPEQVMAVGAAVLKLLKDTTHTPVNGEDGGQPDDEEGEGPGHEMAEAMPGGQEDDAEEGMGYRPADRMALMPPMMFADGGMVAPRRMDIGQWAQGMEQWRGEQAIADARQAKAFQDQADADEYARQQAEASKLRDRQQAGGAQPQLGFADGGMVENDITRVGNSYSGGNVGGNVSINGQVGAGTVSTLPSTSSPAPAASPDPAAAPAASVMASTAPAAPAPAPAAPMGWAERNAQRSAQVTASSIMDSPDRRAAQAKLAAPTPPPPSAVPAPVAGGFQTASQRLGSLPSTGQAGLGFPPRRYADGGTVQDEERAQRLAQLPSGEGNETRAAFGFYPQLAGGQRTSYATDQKLRSGVVATGPSSFEPAVNPAPPAPPAPVGGGDGRRMGATQDPRSLTFAGSPPAAPAPSSNGALSRAAGMASNLPTPTPAPQPGGPVSPQNESAAISLSRRGAAEAMALMPNAPQMDVRAPTVLHSGNDWQARKDLENARTSASSIMNRPDWSGTGMNRFRGGQSGPSPDTIAYQAMLANDLSLRGAQPGMDQAAMRENADNMRAQMQARSAAAQAQAAERGAMDRVLITERGNNTRESIKALAGLEEARIKNSENKPLNDVQAKALQFGTRMLNSGAELDKLAAGGVSQPGLIKRGADAVGLGAAANWTQSGAQQQVEQAQRDFVNAVLRRESGAAISDGEFANARQQYFPQPGDSPEVIAQKRKNRDLATAGVLAEVPNSSQRVSQLMTTVDKNQPAQQGGSQAQPVATQEAYAALPSGSRFVAPDGKVRIKP